MEQYSDTQFPSSFESSIVTPTETGTPNTAFQSQKKHSRFPLLFLGLILVLCGIVMYYFLTSLSSKQKTQLSLNTLTSSPLVSRKKLNVPQEFPDVGISLLIPENWTGEIENTNKTMLRITNGTYYLEIIKNPVSTDENSMYMMEESLTGNIYQTVDHNILISGVIAAKHTRIFPEITTGDKIVSNIFGGSIITNETKSDAPLTSFYTQDNNGATTEYLIKYFYKDNDQNQISTDSASYKESISVLDSIVESIKFLK